MTTIEVIPHLNGMSCVATDRRRNRLLVLPENDVIAEWAGAEVTAACAVRDSVVCAALDGNVYIVAGQSVQPLKHERSSAWIYAAASLEEERCLFGGTFGQLIELHCGRREFRYTTLAEHDLRKPGRDILAFVPHNRRLFVLGKKELLLSYHGDSISTCLPTEGASETSFNAGAILYETLWIVARPGPAQHLAEFNLRSGNLNWHTIPFAGLRSPAITAFRGRLFLGGNDIYSGLPGRWSKIGSFGEDSILRLVPLDTPESSLLAVGYTGKTMTLPVTPEPRGKGKGGKGVSSLVYNRSRKKVSCSRRGRCLTSARRPHADSSHAD